MLLQLQHEYENFKSLGVQLIAWNTTLDELTVKADHAHGYLDERVSHAIQV